MPNRFFDADNYPFSTKDKLCFDTNIWLYLFPPTPSFGGHKWVVSYSKTFKKIRQNRVPIVLDVSVLSEYLNQYARIEWEAYKKTQGSCGSFKMFRSSRYFAPVARIAAFSVSKIIAQCEPMLLPTIKTEFDITHILDDYASVKCDFTDSILAENCRIFGYKLVTNDADFSQIDYGIDIITHNSALF